MFESLFSRFQPAGVEDTGRGQGRLNLFNIFIVANLYLFFKLLYEGAVKYDGFEGQSFKR